MMAKRKKTVNPYTRVHSVTVRVPLKEPGQTPDPNKLTIDELRLIIAGVGVIPPRTLIKFSRLFTIALEEDQARLAHHPGARTLLEVGL
jgi:hypothetical protein